MGEKCMYCGVEISEDAVLSVCKECGHKVWGEKMFSMIVKNMQDSRDNGDLCHMNNTCSFEVQPEIIGEEPGSFGL